MHLKLFSKSQPVFFTMAPRGHDYGIDFDFDMASILDFGLHVDFGSDNSLGFDHSLIFELSFSFVLSGAHCSVCDVVCYSCLYIEFLPALDIVFDAAHVVTGVVDWFLFVLLSLLSRIACLC